MSIQCIFPGHPVTFITIWSTLFTYWHIIWSYSTTPTSLKLAWRTSTITIDIISIVTFLCIFLLYYPFPQNIIIHTPSMIVYPSRQSRHKDELKKSHFIQLRGHDTQEDDDNSIFAVELHVQPFSILHNSLQPSPFMTLLSSHSSIGDIDGVIIPSPHVSGK